jgi:hypothetical protein
MVREFFSPPLLAIFEFEIAEALAVVGDERCADGCFHAFDEKAHGVVPVAGERWITSPAPASRKQRS